MRATHKSGFSLVETMIVVVIIGFLAAIGLPAFQSAADRYYNIVAE